MLFECTGTSSLKLEVASFVGEKLWRLTKVLRACLLPMSLDASIVSVNVGNKLRMIFIHRNNFPVLIFRLCLFVCLFVCFSLVGVICILILMQV